MASGPSQSDEVAFLSGINADGSIARIAFATWAAPTPIDDKSDAPLPTTIVYRNVSEAVKWGSPTPGTSAAITYAFAAGSGWTPVEQQTWQAAFQVWSAVANVTFTQVGDPTSANFFIERGKPAEGDKKSDGAYQNFSSQNPANVAFDSKTLTTPAGTGSKIVVTTADGGFGPLDLNPTTKGGYPLLTLVHEVGHLLGLGHSGPYNGNLNQAIQQYSQYDTRLYAAMSYISPDETNAKYYDSYSVTGTSWGSTVAGDRTFGNVPVTPQMLDILAVQALYGRPTTGGLASGGQVFGFNSNVGPGLDLFYDFNINKNAIVTLWDGGTGNTLDLSKFDKASIVSLVPGTFSSADGKVNNIAIAFDTVIETLRAGSGNDTIIGNVSNNVIQGNAGNDAIDGAAGTNTSVYTALSKGYAVTLTAGAASQSVRAKIGTDGTDTLTNIQKLQFTDRTLDATWFTKTATLSAAQVSSLTDLYVASFNRAPDALGFDYWGSQLKDGMSLSAIAASFFVQPEAKAAYPDGQPTPVFVTEVYSNLLGRAPDPGGLAYWVDQLQSGRVDKATFLLSAIVGALGADATYVANKGAVGAHFALTQGLSDVAAAKTVMSLVNGTAASVAAANAQTDSYAASADTVAGTELVVKILGIMA